MIGRIDDCTQALTENLQTHDTHPDTALKTKLPWSKNVREERDAPWQVLLGSMDALFCVLISVALWLEIMISLPYGDATPYVFGFSADVRVPQGGFKNKTNLQKYARDFIFNRPEFGFNANDPNSRNLLGSHSIRKHASSVCRNKGCTRDKKDHRGRWKNRTRASDLYDDIELPFVDAKVAATLCPGGPAKCNLKPNCGVTNNLSYNVQFPTLLHGFQTEQQSSWGLLRCGAHFLRMLRTFLKLSELG